MTSARRRAENTAKRFNWDDTPATPLVPSRTGAGATGGRVWRSWAARRTVPSATRSSSAAGRRQARGASWRESRGVSGPDAVTGRRRQPDAGDAPPPTPHQRRRFAPPTHQPCHDTRPDNPAPPSAPTPTAKSGEITDFWSIRRPFRAVGTPRRSRPESQPDQVERDRAALRIARRSAPTMRRLIVHLRLGATRVGPLGVLRPGSSRVCRLRHDAGAVLRS